MGHPYTREIDLSLIANLVQEIRQDPDDVISVIMALGIWDIEEGECPTCRVDRPVMIIDGIERCLVCKSEVYLSYDVRIFALRERDIEVPDNFDVDMDNASNAKAYIEYLERE